MSHRANKVLHAYAVMMFRRAHRDKAPGMPDVPYTVAFREATTSTGYKKLQDWYRALPHRERGKALAKMKRECNAVKA